MPAPEGNKYNEIYTLEKELPIFEKILEESKEGKYLSIQEAVMHSPYSRRCFYYICDRFEDLHSIKEDINDTIIAVVNRSALEGNYNATASIWRMKQLGELDRKELTQTITDVTPKTEEERKDRIEQLKEKLND